MNKSDLFGKAFVLIALILGIAAFATSNCGKHGTCHRKAKVECNHKNKHNCEKGCKHKKNAEAKTCHKKSNVECDKKDCPKAKKASKTCDRKNKHDCKKECKKK